MLQIGQIGQRLDVADQCGMAEDPALERPRWLVGRFRRAAVDGLHRRGLLTGDVAACHRDDDDVQTAEGVEADLPECCVEGGDALLIRDVEEGAFGTHHPRGKSQAVDHQVRPMAQQPAVLDRRRFALFAVGDDDGLPATQVRAAHGAQFDRERESGTTATEQSGRLHLGKQSLDVVQQPVSARGGVGAVGLHARGRPDQPGRQARCGGDGQCLR